MRRVILSLNTNPKKHLRKKEYKGKRESTTVDICEKPRLCFESSNRLVLTPLSWTLLKVYIAIQKIVFT